MCLDKVDAQIKVARKTGYKVFTIGNAGLLPPFGTLKGEQRYYPVNEWLEDTRTGNIGLRTGKRGYPKGFHIFATEAGASCFARCFDATKTSTRKVNFSDVVATGEQEIGIYLARVIVARKIKIGEEVK